MVNKLNIQFYHHQKDNIIKKKNLPFIRCHERQSTPLHATIEARSFELYRFCLKPLRLSIASFRNNARTLYGQEEEANKHILISNNITLLKMLVTERYIWLRTYTHNPGNKGIWVKQTPIDCV